MTMVRLHHEVRDAARNRVDDDVGEFAERRVRAMNDAAEPEPHATMEADAPAPDHHPKRVIGLLMPTSALHWPVRIASWWRPPAPFRSCGGSPAQFETTTPNNPNIND
ncbi:MAG TPA: hypothetical protein VK501_22375 [Baekduia sp.]|uniref:hypothetical protein n=1 Tax=Baekduia sp. TaxID=2600305 RepID=UPI002C877A92|nr:hypothetical protein [Baekduia sp.]HMJ36668.1 hypothetical protein [Baekduia sp.]